MHPLSVNQENKKYSNYSLTALDLGRLFPEQRTAYGGDPFAAAPQSRNNTLRVINVGAYEASFVPKIVDFGRLDERFRLPEQVWAKLPGYREFGFAVFKLKRGNSQVHPMAFSFPTAMPLNLYFPTLHIHDGKIHSKETFDHTLYLQGDELDLGSQGWEESPGLAVTKVKCGFTHAMVRPEMHVYRHVLRGVFENGDVTVPVRKA